MTKDEYIHIFMPNEETGQEEEMLVSIPVLFSRMWDEYIRGMMSDDYMRGMLTDLGLNDAGVVHIMELLQAGKAAFEEADYQEVSYT